MSRRLTSPLGSIGPRLLSQESDDSQASGHGDSSHQDQSTSSGRRRSLLSRSVQPEDVVDEPVLPRGMVQSPSPTSSSVERTMSSARRAASSAERFFGLKPDNPSSDSNVAGTGSLGQSAPSGSSAGTRGTNSRIPAVPQGTRRRRGPTAQQVQRAEAGLGLPVSSIPSLAQRRARWRKRRRNNGASANNEAASSSGGRPGSNDQVSGGEQDDGVGGKSPNDGSPVEPDTDVEGGKRSRSSDEFDESERQSKRRRKKREESKESYVESSLSPSGSEAVEGSESKSDEPQVQQVRRSTRAPVRTAGFYKV
ncbi:hypothetical protein QBC41DRAFT_21780 [Cercophora samala]|uniref:Uncharacterized protein n=1 Tax=Cercophora samala TaxID=330535 RepID=A0AA39Z4H5_9PEZI|nr:hypothetical protein QBC41DRAFT_21780 [Cercophora samala]